MRTARMRWAHLRRPPAALALLACSGALAHPQWVGEAAFQLEPEAFAWVEQTLSRVPRCRPRSHWSSDASAAAAAAAGAASRGTCPGPRSAVLNLGSMGPPAADALAALSRATAAAGVPCRLMGNRRVREVLQNVSVILLGDSSLNEDWHYLAWLLYPEALQGDSEHAHALFASSTRMPHGMPPLRGRQLPVDHDGPGLGVDNCWALDDPPAPELKATFCPSHRRGEAVLEGPGGRAEAALMTRYTGHWELPKFHGGINTFFKPSFRREWGLMIQRAVRRGHRVVLVVNSGMHDMLALTAAYQVGQEDQSDTQAGRKALELGVAKWRAQMERLAVLLSRFQMAGAHVIWRGNNHGRGWAGASGTVQHPASHYSFLRRLDEEAKEAFDEHLRPLGAHYLNVSEVTRVYMGDGGWKPWQGWFGKDQKPWNVHFSDGFHIGAIQRYQGNRKGLNASMEVSGLIVQGLLDLIADGCPGAGASAGDP